MEPREIYRSLIRLHVLIEAARRPLDSAGVSAKLQACGLKLGVASVRQILRRFEAVGYLTATPARNRRGGNVYTITATGRKRARDAKKRVGELIQTLGLKELCP
jgi:DNA-binding MarR family transcriptional regulator